MRYIILNVLVMVGVTVLIFLFKPKRSAFKRLIINLLVLLVLTAIFDSLIVSSGIVAYNPENILGIYIGKAPVEDFFYAIVAAILGPLLWDYYEQRN